jgi:hypothetical protein
MKNTDIYKQSQDCLLEDMDGELLLYDPNSAVTLRLNGSSAIVWQLCDGQRTTQDIIGVVQQTYPDQATQIDQDVASVVGELSERNVLVLVN